MAYLSPLDDHYWKCQSFCNKASQKKKKNYSDDYEDFFYKFTFNKKERFVLLSLSEYY